jgi:hypothetical protein
MTESPVFIQIDVYDGDLLLTSIKNNTPLRVSSSSSSTSSSPSPSPTDPNNKKDIFAPSRISLIVPCEAMVKDIMASLASWDKRSYQYIQLQKEMVVPKPNGDDVFAQVKAINIPDRLLAVLGFNSAEEAKSFQERAASIRKSEQWRALVLNIMAQESGLRSAYVQYEDKLGHQRELGQVKMVLSEPLHCLRTVIEHDIMTGIRSAGGQDELPKNWFFASSKRSAFLPAQEATRHVRDIVKAESAASNSSNSNSSAEVAAAEKTTDLKSSSATNTSFDDIVIRDCVLRDDVAPKKKRGRPRKSLSSSSAASAKTTNSSKPKKTTGDDSSSSSKDKKNRKRKEHPTKRQGRPPGTSQKQLLLAFKNGEKDVHQCKDCGECYKKQHNKCPRQNGLNSKKQSKKATPKASKSEGEKSKNSTDDTEDEEDDDDDDDEDVKMEEEDENANGSLEGDDDEEEKEEEEEEEDDENSDDDDQPETNKRQKVEKKPKKKTDSDKDHEMPDPSQGDSKMSASSSSSSAGATPATAAVPTTNGTTAPATRKKLRVIFENQPTVAAAVKDKDGDVTMKTAA